MATRGLPMRKIRELIRLKYQTHLSHEQIARALAVSKGVVTKYAARVQRLGGDPMALLALSDTEIFERVCPLPPRKAYGGRVRPDFAHIHAELRRPGVTMMLLRQEYRDAHGGEAIYQYSQFADLYRVYVASLRRSMRQVHRAGEKLFIDYAG